MKTYFLPEELRPELRKIWGTPLFDGEKEVLKKFQQFTKKRKFKKIITVGDYCSLTIPSNIKIFDGKIKRKRNKKLAKFSLSCSNPAGTIQKEVWEVLKKAIKQKENVFVKGEEDLLVIPTILLSSNKTLVVYGFPEKGICAIEVSSKVKKDIKKLLNRFKL